MKLPFSLLFFITSILLPPCTSSNPSQLSINTFLQCLSNQTHPQYPILESTYTPNNASFQHILTKPLSNLRFSTPETPKPLAIIAAKHVSHVQTTILCANITKLQIRIRSGGHDVEGLSTISTVPFIILDMSNLRNIDIDVVNETAWVESGATLGELYYKISQKSKILAFPAGVCPTVGVGGHFSGGGYGNLMRKYGLSIDNIIDARIVDVHGRVLDRKLMGEDLFWAIRGGGGASFGVILSWKIKLVPVPENVTVFNINKTLDQGGSDVFNQWQHVAHQLPKDVFIRAMPIVSDRTLAIRFIGMFLGPVDDLITLVNKRLPKLGLRRNDCREMSWVESTLFWQEYPIGTPIEILLNRSQNPTIFAKNKSDFVKQVVPKEELEKIWKKMIDVDINLWMQWNPYGGTMSEISESDTPFPHRAMLFKIQYLAIWEDGRRTNDVINKLREFYSLMGSYVSRDPREAFLNYRDLDIGSVAGNDTSYRGAEVYGNKYFRSNFERLVRVKSMVDPDNFFRYEQSIPPTMS